VLATTAENGTPQAAIVGIAVTEELGIVFDTSRASRKIRNLQHQNLVALVILCAGEVTVQYEGIARLPTGTDLAAARLPISPPGPTASHARRGPTSRMWRSGRSGSDIRISPSHHRKSSNSGIDRNQFDSAAAANVSSVPPG
jgi:hypothetical protein